MNQAERLLNSLTNYEDTSDVAESDVEGHIIIGSDRFITVPDSLKRIAVQFDHDIETVTFDCPRYWDGYDMSKMKIYINYLRNDGVIGSYAAENGIPDEIDDSIMHFDWTISRNVTAVDGRLSFLVCIKNVNPDGGIEINHWNSELCTDMYVSEGLECDTVISDVYADVITHLLLRMDIVEAIATPEAMQGYVNEYLNDGTIVREHVWSFMEQTPPTTPEEMLGYVQHYLKDHPPLFVVGPEKPGVKALWFNTSGTSGAERNLTFRITAEHSNDAVYAEVEGKEVPIYNFDII